MALQYTCSTPQHGCGLPGLPLNIHLEIFWLLSSQDILNYGLTCRAIFRVFEKYVFLRYKRALDKQGLRDNPRSDLALEARWALLLDRTRAWLELKPDGDPDAPVKGLLDLDHIAHIVLSPFAFVAGDFASLSSRPSSHFISLLQFPRRIVEPSGDLSFEKRIYYRIPLKLSMQNFKMIGIASAQVLEHNACVYVIQGHDLEVTIVTVGESGCSSTMNHLLLLDATISHVAVEVAGENLAVIMRYSHSDSSRLDEDGEAVTDLLVIDWDTFKTKLGRKTCGRVSDPGFVFLSEELLLNPSSSSCALNIYSNLPTIAFENETAGLPKRPNAPLGFRLWKKATTSPF